MCVVHTEFVLVCMQRNTAPSSGFKYKWQHVRRTELSRMKNTGKLGLKAFLAQLNFTANALCK